jgi:hypothetical protein
LRSTLPGGLSPLGAALDVDAAQPMVATAAREALEGRKNGPARETASNRAFVAHRFRASEHT